MKKTAFILIAFLLILPMLNINQSTVASAPSFTTTKNVTIAIKVLPPCYDEFMTWIQPIAQNFANFTIILMPEGPPNNLTYDWFLKNETRIDQVMKIGEAIPGAGYLQTETPRGRINFLNDTLAEWQQYTGHNPVGFSMFQPDTLSINFLYSQNVSFLLGYCFDQYQVDGMSMRGGWQLPYYANSINALMPENNSASGMVILPWLTWDWIDSFTLGHNFDTHPVDTTKLSLENSTDYILKLISANLDSASPVAYSAFSFEYDWISELNLTHVVSTILTAIIADKSYEKMSAGNFTQWFKTTYITTPTYNVNFVSPNSNQSVEWFFNATSRIARVNNTVVSYVNYQDQTSDKYLTQASPLYFGESPPGNRLIDNSLTFTIDALDGGVLDAPSQHNSVFYTKNLADFPSYYSNLTAIQSTLASGDLNILRIPISTIQWRFSISFVALTIGVFGVILLAERRKKLPQNQR